MSVAEIEAAAYRVGPEDPRWARLKEPFGADEIELKPQPVAKGDQDKGRCQEGSKFSADGVWCGGWHTRSVHLSYVGHAGVTMRLDEVDPYWNWEPMSYDDEGLPKIRDGVLWIRLTILGVTRIGLGDANGKSGPAALKEIVGDAIRNGAMRFGVGTYLWSKSAAAARMAAGDEADEPEATTRPEGVERPLEMQITRLNILVKSKLGIEDRDRKLETIGMRVGRPLRSTKELTRAEAAGLIGELEKRPDQAPAMRSPAPQWRAQVLNLGHTIEATDSYEEFQAVWGAAQASHASGELTEQEISYLREVAARHDAQMRARTVREESAP